MRSDRSFPYFSRTGTWRDGEFQYASTGAGTELSDYFAGRCDVHQMLKKLRELEEEDPQLHIVWDEQLGEIHAMLMGDVQIEILKRLIWERFHVAVDFGTGNIVYKETIAAPVEGVGHFETFAPYVGSSPSSGTRGARKRNAVFYRLQ